ncbi:MAG TPA: hypothetical protein VL860_00635 [Planctomycetota bacterium]|nr:hypothetical protein [Planctomycetota bacterium]
MWDDFLEGFKGGSTPGGADDGAGEGSVHVVRQEGFAEAGGVALGAGGAWLVKR